MRVFNSIISVDLLTYQRAMIVFLVSAVQFFLQNTEWPFEYLSILPPAPQTTKITAVLDLSIYQFVVFS